MLDREVVGTLGQYAIGKVSLDALEEWLAAIDWNDPTISNESREVVGTLRLLCVEVDEGMRNEEEVRRRVVEILNSSAIGLRFPFGTKADFVVSTTATAKTKEQDWTPTVRWSVVAGAPV